VLTVWYPPSCLWTCTTVTWSRLSCNFDANAETHLVILCFDRDTMDGCLAGIPKIWQEISSRFRSAISRDLAAKVPCLTFLRKQPRKPAARPILHHHRVFLVDHKSRKYVCPSEFVSGSRIDTDSVASRSPSITSATGTKRAPEVHACADIAPMVATSVANSDAFTGDPGVVPGSY